MLTSRSVTSLLLSSVLFATGLSVISLKTMPSLETVEEVARVTILSELLPSEIDGDEKGVLKSSGSSCEKVGERGSSTAVTEERPSLALSAVVGVQVCASPRTSQATSSDAWRSAKVEMHKVKTARLGETLSASCRTWRV